MGLKSRLNFSWGHILAFVHLQEEMGGGPHDMAVLVGGEENGPGLPQPHHIALLPGPEEAIARLVQALLEPLEADEGLGAEGGGSLHQVAPLAHKEGEEEDLQLGGELVLSPLPGDLHGKGEDVAV